MVNKSLPIEKLRKHVVPFWDPKVEQTSCTRGTRVSTWRTRRSDAAALLLPAAGAPAVGAQGAAPVAEGAGDTEQRIRRTVPDLPRGNLTVVVLKSLLQMYGGGGRSEETRSNWTPRQWKRL